MGRNKGRKKLFTTIVVVALVVLIIAIVAVAQSLQSNEPPTSTETSQNETPAITDEGETTDMPATDESEETVPETVEEPAIDPATVATIDIEPISLTVSFIKGAGGFGYEVFRTAGGTKYVQFSSEKLIGTKCTDDEGQFASIIESPSADEGATLAKTTTVDGTTYGLSLADPTCTSDAGLLKQFQDAFSQPFTLLKKM